LRLPFHSLSSKEQRAAAYLKGAEKKFYVGGKFNGKPKRSARLAGRRRAWAQKNSQYLSFEPGLSDARPKGVVWGASAE
jgi:hypothetical protein